MKFFFDNNLPPNLAHAIRELSKVESPVPIVIHLIDKFPPNCKDQVWISELGNEGDWVVISQDKFNKNDLEREALRESGLIVFALNKAWAQQEYWMKSQNLVKWWPSIMEQSGRLKGGAAFRVPWQLSGRGKFEQIQI